MQCNFMMLTGAVAKGTPREGTQLDFFDLIKNARKDRVNDTKDGPAFCGPMDNNHRNDKNTQPRNWLCLDIDGLKVPTGEFVTKKDGKKVEKKDSRGITFDDLEWLKKEVSQYCSCFYLTHSDEPNPTGYKAGYGRKVRFVIMMDKDLDGDQWETVSKNFGAELEKRNPDLKGCIDGRSYERSQLMYTCPKRNRDSFLVFDGAPLNPDKYLAQRNNSNGNKKLSKKNYTPSLDSQALATGFKPIAEADPVIEALKQKGLYVGPNARNPRMHDIVCPFADNGEHEAGNRSSTVYMEPGVNNEGEIHRYGVFHCMHDTCRERKQPEFFAAIGLDWNAYTAKIDKETETPDYFQGAYGEYITSNGEVTQITRDGKYTDAKKVFPEIEILGEISDEEFKTDFGRVIQFKNAGGRDCHVVLSDPDLTGDGKNVRELLTSKGLKLIKPNYKTARILCDYIYRRPLKPIDETGLLPQRLVLTHAAGWIKNSYVADEVIGPEKDRIYYEPFKNIRPNCDQLGSLEAWRNSVAYYARFAPPLMLAISAAFAAPMIRLSDWIEQKSGALHFFSTSSVGKTHLLEAACGVCGNPGPKGGRVMTWASTANSLEFKALAHNDSIMGLDELKTAKADAVNDTTYRLSNSVIKGRLDKDVTLREPLSWQMLWLSTGEAPISQYLESKGIPADAGLEVRCIPIEADMGTRCKTDKRQTYGIFERLPDGVKTSKEAITKLAEGIRNNYGVAGRAWIEYLTADKQGAIEKAQRLASIWDERLAKEGLAELGSQQARQMDRIKLCAIGGELATMIGITGWKEGEAIEVAMKLFARMLDGQTTDNNEVQKLIERLQDAAQEEGKFATWYWPDTKFAYGFKKYRKDSRPKEEQVNYDIDTKTKEKEDEPNPEFLLFYNREFKKFVGNLPLKKAITELELRGILIRDSSRNDKAHKLPESEKTKKFITLVYDNLMNYGDSD